MYLAQENTICSREHYVTAQESTIALLKRALLHCSREHYCTAQESTISLKRAVFRSKEFRSKEQCMAEHQCSTKEHLLAQHQGSTKEQYMAQHQGSTKPQNTPPKRTYVAIVFCNNLCQGARIPRKFGHPEKLSKCMCYRRLGVNLGK